MRKTLLILGVAVLSSFISITSYAASWKQDNQGWWYQYDNGGYPVNQWMQDGEKWYYFNSSGYMLANQWMQEGNKWYFFDASGCMVTNQWIGNYYLGADGAMLVNTMTPDGYQVDENGEWIEEQQESKSTLIEITGDNIRDYFDYEHTEEMCLTTEGGEPTIFDFVEVDFVTKYKMKVHRLHVAGTLRTNSDRYKQKSLLDGEDRSIIDVSLNAPINWLAYKGEHVIAMNKYVLYSKHPNDSFSIVLDKYLPKAKTANYKFYPSSISGMIEILE